MVAGFTHAPEVVVPGTLIAFVTNKSRNLTIGHRIVGQIPFQSNFTGATEYLPVMIGLVAHSRCDFMLLDLVGALADKGIVLTTKTGRTAF